MALRSRSVTLGGLALLNVSGGLALQWYVLATLGAGAATDALFASLALPQALLTVIASSFMTVLVPLLAGEDEAEFRQRAWTFAAVTLAVFAAAAGVLGVLAPWWVPVVAPGLGVSTRALAIELARIQLVGMVCTSMAGVLGAVARARHRFVLVESVPVFSTIVSAVVLVGTIHTAGVHAAAWAQVVRIGLHALLLLPMLGAYRGWTGAGVIGLAWRRLRPLMAGTAYVRTEPLFDRALSSLAQPGDLSIYYTSQQVCQATLQLANNAVTAPLVPQLARFAKIGAWPDFGVAVDQSRRFVSRVLIAGYLALMTLVAAVVSTHVLSEPSHAAMVRGGWILLGLAGVVLVLPLAELWRAAAYATGNTAGPARIDALVYTVGLALKAGGFVTLGVFGLALASSLQAVIGAWSLRRLSRVEDGRPAPR